MNRSIKAALLSALLLPGAGHIYLKKTITGFVLAISASSAIYWLVSNAIEMALEISEKIQSGNVPLDVTAITALVETQSAAVESQQINIASMVLLVVWIIGIVDSYRIGRKQK
ncbi:MAG: hypothetical protein ACC707_02355 [Thiohalomonadales bacterium]